MTGEAPELQEARRMRAAADRCLDVDAQLDALVAAMPPPTAEQLTRLRVLFRIA